MIEFKIKTHTVVLMVGPSGCGKTYFSKNHLLPSLEKAYKQHLPSWRTPNIQYLSSDDLRKTLLNDEEVTYSEFTGNQRLMEVSEQAFKLLYTRLELAMSYPVKAEAIVVDTTGLNEVFRGKIKSMVKAAHYNLSCVVFNYKNRDEYFKHIENPETWLISKHINRLRRNTMAEIKRKDFDVLLHLKSKDFQEVDIEVEDAEQYASHFLPAGQEYCMIGDIHGEYDLLIQLLERHGFVIKDGMIVETGSKVPIILGDYIDGSKGESGIINTLNFLYDNREHFKFVMGNHEHFVYRFHKKELDVSTLPTPDFLQTWFPTTGMLGLPNVAEMFCTLVEEYTKPFYVGPNFITTHAPCEEKYLSKLDLKSLRKMRNFIYPKREEGSTIEDYATVLEKEMPYLKEEASKSKPFHVFGHCSFESALRIKNKVGIDTGVSSGGDLTSISLVGQKVYYYSVKPEGTVKPELPNLYSKKTDVAPEIDLRQLDYKERRRLLFAAKNKINYISGTMSPSGSDVAKGTLESVEKALNYYKNLGVTKLCLQPKYMGSRAELFLDCKDITKSYATTRKGYPIRLNLGEAYAKVYEKLKPMIEKENLDWILLDTELMPWHALGQGLIESQYEPVSKGLGSELELLRETGFEEQLTKLQEEMVESEYTKLTSQMSKEKLKKVIPAHKCSAYSALQDFQWIPLDFQDDYYLIYTKQLELYATAGETHFKPFSILKSCSQGVEKLYFDHNNEDLFNLVSDDECCVVDLDDPKALEHAEGFFADIIAKDLEGVVFKPQAAYIKDVAPYMKVRNPNYLSIIYGYDYFFKPKYDRLVRQKRVARKLQASITEYEYGKQLLEIPYDEISKDNTLYTNLVAALILEEKKEEHFDPRL
jgi:hypothetical protein